MSDTAHGTHTPGPWACSFESVDPEWAVITTPSGAVIANINADHRQEANARLIAAAPDLYEALKAMEAALCAGFDTKAQRHAGRKALIAARAALSKSEGRS